MKKYLGYSLSIALILAGAPVKASDKILIYVKTLDEHNYHAYVSPNSTVIGLKNWLQENEGTSLVSQRLIFHSSILDDDKKTLKECEIGHKSTVHLVRKRDTSIKSAKGGDRDKIKRYRVALYGFNLRQLWFTEVKSDLFIEKDRKEYILTKFGLSIHAGLHLEYKNSNQITSYKKFYPKQDLETLLLNTGEESKEEIKLYLVAEHIKFLIVAIVGIIVSIPVIIGSIISSLIKKKRRRRSSSQRPSNTFFK